MCGSNRRFTHKTKHCLYFKGKSYTTEVKNGFLKVAIPKFSVLSKVYFNSNLTVTP